MSGLLLLPRMRVEAANAINSPITYGVPALTHFMGFAHRVQRLVRERAERPDWTVTGVGLVCHSVDVLAERFPGSGRFSLTGNPLTRQGQRPSFIEEGRCHLNVSVLLQTTGDPLWNSGAAGRIRELVLGRTRLAGGMITRLPTVVEVDDELPTLRRLMPGWALIERRDLMMRDPSGPGDRSDDSADAMSTMLDRLALHHQSHWVDAANPGGELDPTRPSESPEQPGPEASAETADAPDAISGNTPSGNPTKWPKGRRRQPGVIVPIAVGYQAISPVTPSNNARDRETPHRFGETVLTLGEFRMPTRFERPSELLWRYHHQRDLYVCRQQTPDDIEAARRSHQPSIG